MQAALLLSSNTSQAKLRASVNKLVERLRVACAITTCIRSIDPAATNLEERPWSISVFELCGPIEGKDASTLPALTCSSLLSTLLARLEVAVALQASQTTEHAEIDPSALLASAFEASSTPDCAASSRLAPESAKQRAQFLARLHTDCESAYAPTGLESIEDAYPEVASPGASGCDGNWCAVHHAFAVALAKPGVSASEIGESFLASMLYHAQRGFGVLVCNAIIIARQYRLILTCCKHYTGICCCDHLLRFCFHCNIAHCTLCS
jgi:hypothetical protein